MSFKWPSNENAGGSIGGILRKTSDHFSGVDSASTFEARAAELLVFGYACKVFRDDEKARDIDQGKHLIPWMGENNLKIDRCIIYFEKLLEIIWHFKHKIYYI